MNLYDLHSDPDQLYLYGEIKDMGTDIFELRLDAVRAFIRARTIEDLRKINDNWDDNWGDQTEIWFSAAMMIAGEVLPHLRELALPIFLDLDRWGLSVPVQWIIKFTKKRVPEFEKNIRNTYGKHDHVDEMIDDYLNFFNIELADLAK